MDSSPHSPASLLSRPWRCCPHPLRRAPVHFHAPEVPHGEDVPNSVPLPRVSFSFAPFRSDESSIAAPAVDASLGKGGEGWCSRSPPHSAPPPLEILDCTPPHSFEVRGVGVVEEEEGGGKVRRGAPRWEATARRCPSPRRTVVRLWHRPSLAKRPRHHHCRTRSWQRKTPAFRYCLSHVAGSRKRAARHGHSSAAFAPPHTRMANSTHAPPAEGHPHPRTGPFCRHKQAASRTSGPLVAPMGVAVWRRMGTKRRVQRLFLAAIAPEPHPTPPRRTGRKPDGHERARRRGRKRSGERRHHAAPGEGILAAEGEVQESGASGERWWGGEGTGHSPPPPPPPRSPHPRSCCLGGGGSGSPHYHYYYYYYY